MSEIEKRKEHRTMKTNRWMAAVTMAAGLMWTGAAGAGDLTPPGPPAPTMHTLEEVYQRVVDLEARMEGAGMSGVVTSITDMAFIPAGPFLMGNCMAPSEGSSNEQPAHSVYVSAFYIDRYEVTKAKWDEVANWAATNGYDITAAGGAGKASTHPVQSVSWYECVKWCNARSEKEGLPTVYRYWFGMQIRTYRTGQQDAFLSPLGTGYRLPTEAEWEKAARGGTAGHRFPWSNSDEIQHARANYFSSASYDYDTSPTRRYHQSYTNAPLPYTSPVRSFAPNGYGLYDMAGNVWEWCWDWYSTSYYSTSPGSDPRGPSSGTYRVLRGGSWLNHANYARVASRYNGSPGSEDNLIGFRCARGL
jgi:formylglycine-generating enzyme required for sulfatase activity